MTPSAQQPRHDDDVMRAWIPIIIALMGMLLAVGYNWRRVDEVASAQEGQRQQLQSIGNVYVRQDVNSAQMADITRQLREIKAILEEKRGPEYARRFDK